MAEQSTDVDRWTAPPRPTGLAGDCQGAGTLEPPRPWPGQGWAAQRVYCAGCGLGVTQLQRPRLAGFARMTYREQQQAASVFSERDLVRVFGPLVVDKLPSPITAICEDLTGCRCPGQCWPARDLPTWQRRPRRACDGGRCRG